MSRLEDLNRTLQNQVPGTITTFDLNDLYAALTPDEVNVVKEMERAKAMKKDNGVIDNSFDTLFSEIVYKYNSNLRLLKQQDPYRYNLIKQICSQSSYISTVETGSDGTTAYIPSNKSSINALEERLENIRKTTFEPTKPTNPLGEALSRGLDRISKALSPVEVEDDAKSNWSDDTVVNGSSNAPVASSSNAPIASSSTQTLDNSRR